MIRYVLHDGRRWAIVGGPVTDLAKVGRELEVDGAPALELERRAGIGRDARTVRIVARVSECSPWSRSGVRHLRSATPHRGRRVLIELDPAAELVTVRLARGRRSGALSCTFVGLYDVLARQRAANTRRDRAHARRTKKRR